MNGNKRMYTRVTLDTFVSRRDMNRDIYDIDGYISRNHKKIEFAYRNCLKAGSPPFVLPRYKRYRLFHRLETRIGGLMLELLASEIKQITISRYRPVLSAIWNILFAIPLAQ